MDKTGGHSENPIGIQTQTLAPDLGGVVDDARRRVVSSLARPRVRLSCRAWSRSPWALLDSISRNSTKHGSELSPQHSQQCNTQIIVSPVTRIFVLIL